MNPVTVKVEIRFDGTNWVDVSADVVLSAGLSISRGRDSETGDAISVGTCSLTLQNDTGEYSPDLPASSHHPNVVEGVHLRVSALADGVYRPRFYGLVQSWDTGPLDETGAQATCLVTAADMLSAFPSYVFRQASDEVIRRFSPVHHWAIRGTDEPVQPEAGAATLVSNGGVGLGDGTLLPLDEGADAHPLFVSSSGKVTLTSGPLSVAAPWRIYLVVLTQPTANGTLLRVKTSVDLRDLTWDTTNGFTMSGIWTGIPAAWPALVEISSESSSRLMLRAITADGTALEKPGVAASDIDGTLNALTLNPVLSGGSSWGAGHLAVFNAQWDPDSSPYFAPAPLAEDLFAERLTASAPSVLASAAGAVAITGTPGDITLPPLDGRDAADVMGAIVTGMGARLVDNLSGSLRWVPFADATAAITIPSGLVDPSVRWRTDSAGWVSDVTVTWPDGTSYTATRADGKRQSGSIEGVHATRALDRSYANWLVNAASRGARLPVAPFDLASMAEADKVTLCSVNPASRVSLTGLPAHMPSSLTCICEGVDETLTDVSWDMTLKLSPDVYSRLGIYDTSTWDSGVLWAP